MVSFLHRGPTCQTRHWYPGVDEDTPIRVPRSTHQPLRLDEAGSSAAPSRVVASGQCAYLNPRSRGTVQAPQAAFDRLRANADAGRISDPAPKASHRWTDGSSSAALEQQIRIGSHTIDVIRPTDDQARGKNLPTTQQLAEALRAIPAQQLAHTRTVIVSPTPHPNSTAERTIGGEGSASEIFLYPVPDAQTQLDYDNRVMHESGHNYQAQVWRSADGVSAWQRAADADGRRPSPYAAMNAGEDFCEFRILYMAAKGTGCEATARQIYPNRWAKMRSYT